MRATSAALVVVALLTIGAAAPTHAAQAPSASLVPATAADVLRAVNAPGAKVVMLNVWATWCLPCREEMPDILRLRRAYLARGLRVILVSGDFSADADQAAAFLHEQGVDFTTYLKNEGDMAFIDALDPKWSGALPATFIYDGEGHLRHSIYGLASYDRFEREVGSVLSGPASSR